LNGGHSGNASGLRFLPTLQPGYDHRENKFQYALMLKGNSAFKELIRHRPYVLVAKRLHAGHPRMRATLPAGDVWSAFVLEHKKKLSWFLLLPQPHLLHQLSKPWVRTYGVE
jgi:hypothetical protein